MSHFHFYLPPALGKLISLIVVGAWVLKDEKDKSRQVLFLAVVAGLLYQGIFNAFMSKANSLIHWKYDYYLFEVDRALGISSGGVALVCQGAWPTLTVVYNLILPVMILWLAVNRKANAVLVRGYAAELIIGPLLYFVLPAAGPVYAFEGLWRHPPLVQAKLIQMDAAPINAFPSLHLASAMLLVLTAGNRWLRWFSVAFLAATAVSTLTTGEHYVIDLAGGLAMGCFAACSGQLRFRRAMAYLTLTLAWSLGIRLGFDWLVAHPGLVRLFAALTVIIAIHAVWVEWQAGARSPHGENAVPAPNEASLQAVPPA
jgi:hypothetical protein